MTGSDQNQSGSKAAGCDGPPRETCSQHVAAVLALDRRQGLRFALEDWIEDNRKGRRALRTIDIPGTLLPGSNVDHMSLTYDHARACVLSKVTYTGGHALVEDEPGEIRMFLHAQLPASLVPELPGRRLSEVFMAPGTAGIAITEAEQLDPDALSCPLLSGPLTMRVWIKEGTTNACEKAQSGRDHREAA